MYRLQLKNAFEGVALLVVVCTLIVIIFRGEVSRETTEVEDFTATSREACKQMGIELSLVAPFYVDPQTRQVYLPAGN